MTNKARFFRSWLRAHYACRSGMAFAGGREPIDVLTDGALSIAHMSWYLMKLDLPADFTSPLSGITFLDLSMPARWRLLTKRLRVSTWAIPDPTKVVFYQLPNGRFTLSPYLDDHAFVPVPRECISGRGERAYRFARGSATGEGVFIQDWMARQ